MDSCKDTAVDCNKPIAVQVEDHSDGKVLSSVGVQFVLKVTSPPVISAKRRQEAEEANSGIARSAYGEILLRFFEKS